MSNTVKPAGIEIYCLLERFDRQWPTEEKLTKLDWTYEQTHALDLFREGHDLRINALAGCGKTTILRAMAENTHRRIVYLAFNDQIAKESVKSFPANASCMTTHALVHRQLPTALKNKVRQGRYELTVPLVLAFLRDRFDIESKALAYAAQTVVRTLQSFFISIDNEIGPQHSPYFELRSGGTGREGDEEQRPEIEWSRAAWQSIIRPNGVLPLSHDAYLKLGHLSGVRFDYDIVLVDELQDLNPVTLDIIARSGCQVVYVGDRHQQLYEWRGARDAMDSVSVDRDASLTMSWRLGPAIADIANNILRRLTDEQIRPNPKVQAVIAKRHQRVRILRSNTSLFTKTVECAAQHKRVHILGGTAQLHALVDAVEQLQQEKQVWDGVFSGYDNWQSVRADALRRRGGSLKQFVKLADELGVDRMRRGLNKLPKNEDDADIVLSTVHAAKGCERPYVSIYNDFKGDELLLRGKYRAIPAEQFRLVYVAVTRAQKSLFVESGLRKRFNI